MRPSGVSATTSVNVPPRSIQNCHLPAAMPQRSLSMRAADLYREVPALEDRRGVDLGFSRIRNVPPSG